MRWLQEQRDPHAPPGTRWNPWYLQHTGPKSDTSGWFCNDQGSVNVVWIVLHWCHRCQHWCDDRSSLCSEFCPDHVAHHQFDLFPEGLEPPSSAA